MPASIVQDMGSQSGALEDQRNWQIALEMELSKMRLHENGEGPPVPVAPVQFDNEHSSRKSANMTECVPVPSSEHVAEIVGRQGCKIKALRAKTNTYIKTPVRGEEPVFVVTGRKEDVGAAKREILSAAEHFSQIRASRRNNNGGTAGPHGPPSPTTPGQVTIQVRVPYRVVGLVVGPKGATIKRIQQQTSTYIVTPSRDKDPIFEVTGLAENVEKARVEIESHIAMRTGGMLDSNVNGIANSITALNNIANSAHDEHNDFHINGVDSGFHEPNSAEVVGSVYKPPSSNSAFTSYNSALNNSNNPPQPQHMTQDCNIFNFPNAPTMNGTAKMSNYTSLNQNGFNMSPPSNGFELYDSDEGIGSPGFEQTPMPLSSNIWATLSENHNGVASLFTPINKTGVMGRRSNSMNMSSNTTAPCLSPTYTDSSNASDHAAIRRIRSDPLTGGLPSLTTCASLPNNQPTSSASLSNSNSSSASPTGSSGSLTRRRSCFVCMDSDIVAALIPCGHNHFCMECANLVLGKTKNERQCPVCQQLVSQAIRIYS